MAQPVWTLSVDLQTKTATFQSGMSDAAKAARGSFQEIKSGAADMSGATSGSMMEARHGVMLLGEEFGVHLPRGITMFLSSLGPVASVMEAAFPFLAIAVGATMLLEHLAKLKEAGEKLSQSQLNFGTTVANVFSALDAKLLEAGIRTDELNGNHLAALNKQLQLIDHQSLEELVHSFDEVSKAADLTFNQMKASWYQFGSGSTGAKHALDDFKSHYDNLIAQGKDKDASDLLSGTLQSAQHILQLQEQIKSNKTVTDSQGTHVDYTKNQAASNELAKLGIGYTEKEVQAQQTLVDALQAQVTVQQKVADLKAAQSGNAKQSTEDKIDTDADKQYRDQAQAERTAVEESDKLQEQHRREAIENLQTSEKEKIAATEQGSAARLAVINAAIKEEESKGLEDEGFYKSLLTSRVEVARQMADEQAKEESEAGKEAAQQKEKMNMLGLAATREADELALSAKRQTDQDRVNEDTKLANQEYAIKMTSLSQQIAALNKGEKDYLNKVKQLQDQEKDLTQSHENQLTQIREKAEEARNARILSADTRFNDQIANSLARSITGHQSWARMMNQLGDQVVTGMLENAIKSILADDMTKEHDAAAAARKAYLAGMQFPFPANVIMGPTLAAMAFTSVMAFEEGGIVPGVELGDKVPAMLTAGEAVLPKSLTESLTNMAKFGSTDTPDVHFHHNAEYHIHAIDGASVKGMLDKHGDTFAKHFSDHVRKTMR